MSTKRTPAEDSPPNVPPAAHATTAPDDYVRENASSQKYRERAAIRRKREHTEVVTYLVFAALVARKDLPAHNERAAWIENAKAAAAALVEACDAGEEEES